MKKEEGGIREFSKIGGKVFNSDVVSDFRDTTGGVPIFLAEFGIAVGAIIAARVTGASGMNMLSEQLNITGAVGVLDLVIVFLNRNKNFSGPIITTLLRAVEVCTRMGLVPARLAAKLGIIIKDSAAELKGILDEAGLKGILSKMQTEIEKNKAAKIEREAGKLAKQDKTARQGKLEDGLNSQKTIIEERQDKFKRL